MKQMVLRLVGALLALMLLVLAGGQLDAASIEGLLSRAPDAAVEVQPGEILVKFRDEATLNTVAGLLAAAKAEPVRALYGSDVQLLHVPAGDEWQAVAILENDPRVVYAEPNFLYHAFTTPNDPEFSKQWAHTRMQSEAAWDLTTGSAGITIAILDSGVDEGHPDLSGKLVAGYDFIDGDSNPHDLNGHGTHVSGIAAATTNNGAGVAGTDWQARIMPVRVLNEEGTGSTSGIIEGINWAVANGADVLNMSLGGPSASPSLQTAINNAHNAGALVIVSMGNDDSGIAQYPAAFSNVMAVAATSQSDTKASYSNYGGHCDIAAPGGDMTYYHDPKGIYSTMPTYDVFMTTAYSYSKNYDFAQGTSQASPYVSGLAALVWAQNPSFTPDQVQARIEDTADDLGASGWDQFFGHGRINALAALQVSSVPAAPVLAVIGNPDGDGDFLVDWNDVSGATSYELQEDDNAGFSSPQTVYAGAASQFSVAGQPVGAWHFRVRASNGSGDSEWSNSRTVNVLPAAPVLAAIVNPTHADAYTVSWGAVNGADTYTLEEADNPSMTGAIVRYRGTGLQYNVTGQRDGTWHYRVQASGNGLTSAWSSNRSTTVDPHPLGIPVLDAIANGDANGDYTLSWSQVPFATGYLLEESATPYFDAPQQIYYGAQAAYDVTGQASGTWYYRVRADGPSGMGAWSSARLTRVEFRIFLPAAMREYVKPGSVANGGFEAGPIVWVEYSSGGLPLILDDSYPEMPTPHNGDWAAWLGGANDERSYIQQDVTVSALTPHLAYWYQISSNDFLCGADTGSVFVNGSAVETFNLCVSTQTGGWVQDSVDLSAYAGQMVTLRLEAETDVLFFSSLFLDDIDFQATAVTVTPSLGEPAAAPVKMQTAAPKNSD
ncbi:MAG: peptidase S8 [Anaerolineae bacterium]|nr:peptidase S8 [Anaerolineae bacterium]